MCVHRSLVVVLACCAFAGLAGVSTGAAERTVVVYAALDRQFSEPLLQEFTRATGIDVQPVFDTESTKTIGLTNRIRAEKDRPRCDVFWNNEILNTLRLREEGLLEPCRPPNAEGYPPEFRDPDGYWYGFAARARVLIVNTDLVPPTEIPASIRDLANPKWRGRVGIAKPLFGTTASHVACLFAALGAEAAEGLLGSFRSNDIRILGGNKACAEMVGAGALAFALTDTDDAVIEVDAGRPVRVVFPDQDERGIGALLLPNTLAVVRGAPHPREAEALIDYLLSAEVEARLAAGPSAQIPLRAAAKTKSRVGELAAIRAMRVEFRDALREFDRAARYVEANFLD
ncbi:MAG: extracellular solute-binding protein [Phycisphaerae bacterium]|jgi:iron(III) transport system substrate-binding protein